MNNITQALASSGFKTIDFLILVAYLVILIGATKKARKRQPTTTSLPVTH